MKLFRGFCEQESVTELRKEKKINSYKKKS